MADVAGTARAVRKTASNLGALVGAYVAGRGFNFVAVVVAARVLGTADFGAYGTAAALAVMWSLASTLGMLPLLVREISRVPEAAGRWLAGAHRIKHGANLLMLVGLGMTGVVLGFSPRLLAATLLLGVANGIASYVENLGAWFQAVERMGAWMWANAVFGFVTGVVGIALLLLSGSLVVFCAAPLLGQVASLLFLRSRLPAGLGGTPPSRGDVRRLLGATMPFTAAFVALTLYYKIDVLLLERWRGMEAVGLYTAAYRFVDVFHALVLAGVGAVYPRLSRQAAHGEGRFRAPRRVGEFVLLAAVPAAASLLFVRGPLVGALYGEAYEGSIAVLSVLALVLPALAFNLYAGYLLAARGRMRVMATLYAGGVVLNLGANAVLIPALGARGAALAMLVSEMVLAGAFLWALAGSPASTPGARAWMGVAGALGLAGAMPLLPDPTGGVFRALAYAVLTAGFYRLSRMLEPWEVAAVREALTGGGDRDAGDAPDPGEPERMVGIRAGEGS